MKKNLTKYSTVPLLLFCCFSAQAQYNDCGLDNNSIHLTRLIVENSGQKRSTLKCNKLLAIAALKKAKTLANANEISHTIDHVTANEFLEKNGVKLPANYQIFGNQVEVIQGGMETSH